MKDQEQSKERILDACLAEVLGGETPPDLSRQILSRLAGDKPTRHAPPARSRSWDKWLVAGLAAGVAGLFVGYGVWNRQPGPGLNQAPLAKDFEPLMQPDKTLLVEEKKPNPERLVDVRPPQSPPTDLPSQPTPAPQDMPRIVDVPAPRVPAPNVYASASRSDEEIVAGINTGIRREWEENDVKPASPASDAEWVRRVYLDVLGRIPTVEETTGYLADRSPRKKAKLVDRLLDSDECLEDYARNWTNIWSTLLIGRAPANDASVDREGFQQYLRRSFLRNKPYDRFVSELVSAQGSNRPGDEDYNGAVNFLLANLQADGVTATAKTARIFMGTQIQCTQCHNHPFNDWKQEQFWELDAFFRQAKAVPVLDGRKVGATRLTDVNFVGEDGDLNEAAVYWETRNGLMKSSLPRFLDGTPIPPSGDVTKVNRRAELARLMVQSELVPRAQVNRLWAHFLGYGFTRPVDDIGPHTPVSHAATFEQLARDFAGRGFDQKSLVRWIVLSEPYGLSSRRPKDTPDDPAAGNLPLFSYFYSRQMRAEELYESLLVATGGERTELAFEDHQRGKAGWLAQFNTALGTDENDEATTYDGTISQTLEMWNGDLMQRATQAKPGSFLSQVAANEQKSVAKIQQLFTATLGRKPTAAELQLAEQLWQKRPGDRVSALEDIFWSLLNSNEFIINH